MVTGTCHFESIFAAIRYYADYGYDNVNMAVLRKLREGEIKIGPPKLKEGERVFLNDEGRYCIRKVEA
jgi:hypothetical protein